MRDMQQVKGRCDSTDDVVSVDFVKHTAFLAIGSNLGDREYYLRLAVNELGGVVAMSQVFETEPIGGPDDQGAYLNMVVKVETVHARYRHSVLRRSTHRRRDARYSAPSNVRASFRVGATQRDCTGTLPRRLGSGAAAGRNHSSGPVAAVRRSNARTFAG